MERELASRGDTGVIGAQRVHIRRAREAVRTNLAPCLFLLLMCDLMTFYYLCD